ncbi:hypothetical protein AF71_00026580 [Rhizobium sp. 57MFTsu3.2]|nr:hypothetical protein [Rhizobium sp. 57MFTsu3.2]
MLVQGSPRRTELFDGSRSFRSLFDTQASVASGSAPRLVSRAERAARYALLARSIYASLSTSPAIRFCSAATTDPTPGLSNSGNAAAAA